MTASVKSIQDQFKKKKKKEKIEKVLVFNSSSSSVTSAASAQNSPSQFRSLNTHMSAVNVDAVLADYDFCASFIADDGSDSHVINCFYQNCLMNICSANDVKIHHDSDVTSVKLIDDVYYNTYDQYDCLI